MQILACDTSGQTVSVAIWRDQAIIVEKTLNVGLIHSLTFMPLVEQLLWETATNIGEIDLYAVATGPGSYTGIRIGISAVQAMAYAKDKPVAGFTTLEIMAFPFLETGEGLICPLLDARNDRVYAGCWLEKELVVPIKNYALADFSDQVDRLARQQKTKIVLVTPAKDLNWPGRTAPLVMSPALSYARAAVIADLAFQAWQAGKVSEPGQLEATYFAPSAAERLYGQQ